VVCSAIFRAYALPENSAQFRRNRSQLNKFVVVGRVVTPNIRQIDHSGAQRRQFLNVAVVAYSVLSAGDEF
jgi:hypothetical protein